MSYEPRIRDDVIALGCLALAAVAVASFVACWSGGAFGQSFEEWDKRLRKDLAPSVGPERSSPIRPGAAKTVLYEERGGRLVDHWERWKALAAQGGEVEIRGPCWSACTLIMAHIPRERLCFDKHAELNFHLAYAPESGEPSMEASRWMVDQYPEDIRKWLKTMGGVERMPLPSPNHPAGTFYMLFPVQLWAMGYRKCAGGRLVAQRPATKKAPQEGGAKVRGDYEILACPCSPPNKPIDAATN